MQIPDIPFICTLTDAEFRERERSVLSKLMPAVLDTQESKKASATGFLRTTRY